MDDESIEALFRATFQRWTFQLIESGIFTALTVVLVALTVRWIRRRIV